MPFSKNPRVPKELKKPKGGTLPDLQKILCYLQTVKTVKGGFGARTLIGEKVVQFGAGWVDDDGLQFEDNSHYTMSSNNIFGGPMTPNTDSEESLTRVTFTVPYPIEPIMNGISPQTSNPLPHVTGIAEWDLRNPVDYFSVGAQDDLVMSFKLKQDNSFPV